MKNLYKTASAQNFAGFICKFETMSKDILQVDVSPDLQELKNGVEQKEPEVVPLPQETVDFVINFLKTQGNNDGRAIRFEFSHGGEKSEISYITNNPTFLEGDCLGIQVGNDFYWSDLNGKVLVPRGIRKNKVDEYTEKSQKVINDVLNNLQNQY